MKISNRDWVNLSSYLDGEFNPAELNKFEERLQNEPLLQHALEELRQTKRTLAHTPTLRVPRNFILTPAMVGLKTRLRLVKGYRLASALMTFFLIGVLVLDFGRGFVSGSMAPAAPKEVMLEAVSDSVEESLEEPALMEAEGEMESDRAVAEADIPIGEAAPAAEAAAEGVDEEESVGLAQEPDTKSGADEAGDSAANQAEEWQEEETSEEVAEEAEAQSQALGTEVPGTPISEPPISEYYPDEEIHSIERTPSFDPFRILEIILGLGAITFGITAWVIRRRKSK